PGSRHPRARARAASFHRRVSDQDQRPRNRAHRSRSRKLALGALSPPAQTRRYGKWRNRVSIAAMSSERQHVERRLAAVLAADVAMGADEEGTHAALTALRREVTGPKIAKHRGRIVKTTGDGLLVEFASVVDAVRCAV